MKSLLGIGVQLVGLASDLPNETRVLLGQFVQGFLIRSWVSAIS